MEFSVSQNLPPKLNIPISNITTHVSNPIEIPFPSDTFIDPEGFNDLIYLLEIPTNPNSTRKWMEYTSETNTLSGTPLVEDIGDFSLTLKAKDNYNKEGTV